MKKVKDVTAIGPASSANLGSGFDCFAIALDNLYDTVKITKSELESMGFEAATIDLAI